MAELPPVPTILTGNDNSPPVGRSISDHRSARIFQLSIFCDNDLPLSGLQSSKAAFKRSSFSATSRRLASMSRSDQS